MAWTEQCKIAFKVSAAALVGQQKLEERNVSEVLIKLSEDSGIPVKTLNRWYYEREESYPNNEVTAEEGEEVVTTNKKESLPRCSKCGHGLVERARGSNEPHKSGLCWSCRRKASAEKKAKEDRQKFEDTPVNPEADQEWREVARKLDEIMESIVSLDKVSPETLEMVISAYRSIGNKVNIIIDLSTYQSASG